MDTNLSWPPRVNLQGGAVGYIYWNIIPCSVLLLLFSVVLSFLHTLFFIIYVLGFHPFFYMTVVSNIF